MGPSRQMTSPAADLSCCIMAICYSNIHGCHLVILHHITLTLPPPKIFTTTEKALFRLGRLVTLNRRRFRWRSHGWFQRRSFHGCWQLCWYLRFYLRERFIVGGLMTLPKRRRFAKRCWWHHLSDFRPTADLRWTALVRLIWGLFR